MGLESPLKLAVILSQVKFLSRFYIDGFILGIIIAGVLGSVFPGIGLPRRAF